MNARKNNDELRILQTRMQSLQSRKAEIDEELRKLNRKSMYFRYIGTKFRQNEYGTRLDLTVRPRRWYIIWVYIREFFRALMRIKIEWN